MTEDIDDDTQVTEDREHTEFDSGIDAGVSIGHYEAYREVEKVFTALGERGVVLWLDKNRPRTLEEWEQFEADNPDGSPLDVALAGVDTDAVVEEEG